MLKKKLLSVLIIASMIATFMPAMAYADVALTSDESSQSILLLNAKTSGKKAIKLSWNKVSGATKYVIYGNSCGKKNRKVVSINSSNKQSYTVKKISGKRLKAHKPYKFYITAFKGNEKVISSKSIHFITAKTMGKYANASRVSAEKALTIETGNSANVNAKYKVYKNKKHLPKSHGKYAFRYISSNEEVAVINEKGVVTAKSEIGGATATIYAIELSGKVAKTEVTVTSKEPEPSPTPDPTPGPSSDDDQGDYLTFTAVSGDASFSYKCKNTDTYTYTGTALRYCSGDSHNWVDLSADSIVNISSGESVQLKATDGYAQYRKTNGIAADIQFKMFGGDIAASGNIMSLSDPKLAENKVLSNEFEETFKDCTNLVYAPLLPATELSESCYLSMFYSCKRLKSAPQLPAKVLANNCYGSMFIDCQSLVEAPKLQSTQLADECYKNMFANCTSLVELPDLPAKELKEGCYYGMFQSCSNVTSAPELHADTMAKSCYQGMFTMCTSLSEAPELKSESLAELCYSGMFFRCVSLIKAPNLPAKTLKPSCYAQMFHTCLKLREAPELPATTMAENCYYSMFQGCKELEVAPELPATILAAHCYYAMFNNCVKLEVAPELPATTLAESCYSAMFGGCSSLEYSPTLPAKTLVEKCYNNIFNGCTNMTKISVGISDSAHWDANWETCTNNWVKNVSSNGTFICEDEITRGTGGTGDCGIPQGWNIKHRRPLTLTATGDAVDVTISSICEEDMLPSVSLKYCTSDANGNTGDWISFTVGKDYWEEYEEGTVVSLANGESVSFIATSENATFSNSRYDTDVYAFIFSGSGKIECSGSCMSLLYNDYKWKTSVPDYAFSHLFDDNFSMNSMYLISTPELPATQLGVSCYSSMFANQGDLKRAQELPARKLSDYCYQGMFKACYGLTCAPKLPAKYLAKYCYECMFGEGCTFEKSPFLPATELVEGCYNNMFCDTLVKDVYVGFTEWDDSCLDCFLGGIADCLEPPFYFHCKPSFPEDQVPERWTKVADIPE